MFGGIEAGGTKFICGIGTCPEDLQTAQFPTSSPDITVKSALQFFREQRGHIDAIGIGSFGPIICTPPRRLTVT